MDKIKIGTDVLRDGESKSIAFALIQLSRIEGVGESPFEIDPKVAEALVGYIPDPFVVGRTVALLISQGIMEVNDLQCFSVDKRSGEIIFGTEEEMLALLEQDRIDIEKDRQRFLDEGAFMVPGVVGHA